MTPDAPRSARTKSGPALFDAAEVEAARRNIARYDWARAERDYVVEQCRPWVEMPDGAIWNVVPGQAVPRGMHVNTRLGCPSCGRSIHAHGQHAWRTRLDRPWRIECPSCGEIYPKNDFGAFHESGRGAGGEFDRRRADESLLVNADHPDPADPLHRHAVDDGLGWVDPAGNRWWFIGYYNHWCVWQELPSAAHALGLAYLYTGDRVYAHKGAILLDRIADVYPRMDIAPYTAMGLYNSHGGRGTGRILGCIWENLVAEGLSQAYDMIYEGMRDDRALVDFLSAHADRWRIPNRKGDLAAIRENIETNLLREFIQSCKDRRIRGNEGMTQAAMATAAAVLDDASETPRALDWLFEPGTIMEGGGRIPEVLTGKVDRHGIGNESSPSYCFLWLNSFRRCARVLKRCGRYRDLDLYRDYPRLVRMLAAPYRLSVLDAYSLHVGDTGKTGDPLLCSVNLRVALDGLQQSEDPYFARLAFRLNGGQARELRVGLMDEAPGRETMRIARYAALGLHTPMFESDIEGLLRKIARGAAEGPLELGSENLNGYGAAILRSGEGAGRRAAWLYYGRNLGHGHRDRLNYGLYYRGMDLTPDHGNPEYKDALWPGRPGWTSNTLSHNTVMVGRRQQDETWTGHCELFGACAGIGVVEVSSPEAYREARDYRRTLAYVDLSDSESYVMDIFRVDGGDDHLLSFHGGEGDVTVEGIDLAPQEGGTYAGPEIARGTHYDGPSDGRYRGSGFAYLYDVAKTRNAAPGWFAEWRLVDTWRARIGPDPVRLRYHALSPADEVAIASGDTPRNQVGNPERLRYLLQRRRPVSGRSLFASVVEPYSGNRLNLAQVGRIDIGLGPDDLTAVAVRIETTRGREDRLISSLDPDRAFDLGGGVRVAGRFALVLRHPDGAWEIYLLGGARVDTPLGSLRADRGAIEGRVADFHRGETGTAWIDVEGDLPEGDRLRGAQIRVQNDSEQDACYRVETVARGTRGLRRIFVGDTTLIRGFADHTDYGSGHVHNIKPGQTFDIQIEVHLSVANEQVRPIRATTAFRWVD